MFAQQHPSAIADVAVAEGCCADAHDVQLDVDDIPHVHVYDGGAVGDNVCGSPLAHPKIGRARLRSEDIIDVTKPSADAPRRYCSA